MAQLTRAEPQTPDTTLYTFRFADAVQQKAFSFEPGQFVLLSVFGAGEAPFGICSSPNKTETFQLCIRSVGRLTRTIPKLTPGDIVGIRGPYGRGWPMKELPGKNILVVTGGIGLVPIRPLILDVLENRTKYGKLQILYGCRCPEELLYRDDLYLWEHRNDVEYAGTVDRDDTKCWAGNIGVVTTLFERVKVSPENTFALICGPPVMYRFVLRDLQKLGFPDDHMYFSLERRMKCGVGHCSHCIVGTKFVCQDGPVFTYAELKTMQGAL
jgi:NAD(P)H-flavin reductase